jgi:hypothetical protein
MASTYSPNLRIELIGNGEQSNTWGTTTNTNLGTLIEQAISGLVSVDVTAGNVTLTSLNGASDQSRQMIIVATGTPGVTRTITAPAVNKVYIVYNNSNAALSFIASGGTGVSLSVGAKKLIYCDGTNFVEAINSVAITSGSINGTTIGATTASTGAFTTLSASSTVSGTGFSTYLASPPAIGGTTAAAGKFTTLEYTGTLTGSTGILNIGSGQLYKDASGNVGIGCTPNVNSGQKLQLGTYQSIGATGIYQNLGYYAVGGVANWRYPLGTTGWLSGSILTGGGSYYLQVFGAPACTGAVDSVASENLLYYIDSSFNHVWRRSGSAESMRIDSSGNVLVGTTTQVESSKLTIYGASGTAGSGLGFAASGVTNKYAIAIDSTGGLTTRKDSVDFWYLGRSGSANCVSSGGSWVNSSDERLKDNIETLPNALKNVLKLRGVSFMRKATQQQEIGVIAQEVKRIYPEVVEDSGDMLGVNYGALTGVLIEAIKEQQTLIEALTARLTKAGL